MKPEWESEWKTSKVSTLKILGRDRKNSNTNWGKRENEKRKCFIIQFICCLLGIRFEQCFHKYRKKAIELHLNMWLIFCIQRPNQHKWWSCAVERYSHSVNWPNNTVNWKSHVFIHCSWCTTNFLRLRYLYSLSPLLASRSSPTIYWWFCHPTAANHLTEGAKKNLKSILSFSFTLTTKWNGHWIIQ